MTVLRWWAISAARMRESRRFWLICRRAKVRDHFMREYGVPFKVAQAIGLLTYRTSDDR